jgi:hypothetical protein
MRNAVKAALTTGVLSLLIDAMPTASETVHTRVAQSGAGSWVPGFAIPYAHYVSTAPEPLRLFMVGSGMVLFGFVIRRCGPVARPAVSK